MEEKSVLRPPQRTTLLDFTIEALRNAVLNGELNPGDRVNELSLSNRLEISRTTIREALRQLEQAGLLVRIPYRGTFVSEFSDEKTADLNRLRSVLESYAAEILIEKGRNTSEDLSELYALAARMEGLDPERDAARANALHIQFHRTLLDLTENKLLLAVWNDLSLQFWVAMRVSQLSGIAQGRTTSFATAHREMADAIASGDMERVRKTIRFHIS